MLPTILQPEPLPELVHPAALAREALHRLRPPKRLNVSEAAERYRVLRNPGGGYSGPWRNDQVPYMVEPMDMMTSRRHRGLIFAGPAQSAKTAGLIENSIVYRVVVDPADMLIVQMSETMARDFSRRRVDRMNRESLELWRRLDHGRTGDNVGDKTYRGMILSIGWPTVKQLSSRPIPWVLLTDYDRMPEDVDGEGAAFDLGQKRTQTFQSRGMTAAESSPGYPVLNAKWQAPAECPHEAPPVRGGVLALYNRGDRRRWYWPCPHCGEYFEGRFKHLHWPAHLPKVDAAQAVVMVCPVNGCVIEPTRKRWMNARGRWVPEGQRITPEGELIGQPRQSDIVSYWLFGPAAAFQSWSEMVAKYIDATEEFERSGSEQALKATITTDQGEAFVPHAAAARDALEANALLARVEPYVLGKVPADCRFLVAAVDVQKESFEVLVRGYGVGLESWVISRYRIFATADGSRTVDPGRFAEDWGLLIDQVLSRGWPLAGDAGRQMNVAAMTVDSGGAPGVTANAYRFYRMCRRNGLHKRVALTKGSGRPDTPRVKLTWPDLQERKDRRANARGEVPVWLFNTNLLKDEIAVQLGRDAPGEGYVHLSRELMDPEPPHRFFDELTAEERAPDGRWTKVKQRNEAFDLMVMTHIAALVLKADRIDWSAPVAWARPHDTNAMIAAIGAPSSGPTGSRSGRRIRSKGVG